MRRSRVRFSLWALQSPWSAASSAHRRSLRNGLTQDPPKISGLGWPRCVARYATPARSLGAHRPAASRLDTSACPSTHAYRPWDQARGTGASRAGHICQHVGDQLSPTTVREYRRLSTKLLHPDLGTVPLRRVTTQRIDSYYGRLSRERGLSPASVRHVHAVIRGALGQALRWGWIPVNPAVTASPPKLRRREIQPPSVADARTLLEAAEQDPDGAALLRMLVACPTVRRRCTPTRSPRHFSACAVASASSASVSTTCATSTRLSCWPPAFQFAR